VFVNFAKTEFKPFFYGYYNSATLFHVVYCTSDFINYNLFAFKDEQITDKNPFDNEQ